jgi:hypothetical protein
LGALMLGPKLERLTTIVIGTMNFTDHVTKRLFLLFFI